MGFLPSSRSRAVFLLLKTNIVNDMAYTRTFLLAPVCDTANNADEARLWHHSGCRGWSWAREVGTVSAFRALGVKKVLNARIESRWPR